MLIPPITEEQKFSKVLGDLLDIANLILGDKPFLISYINERTFRSLKVMDHEIFTEGMMIPIEYTYCHEVFKNKKPLVVPDITDAVQDYKSEQVKRLNLCSYAGVPILLGDGSVFGTFCVFDQQPNVFDDKTIKLLEKLASFLAYAIDLQIINAKDPMTGLYNRRFWGKVFDNLPEQEGDHAIAILDIDSLKQINDQLGHEKGDQLIRNFSQIIRETIPWDAYGFRLGGDEFGIVFYNKNTSQSRLYIEEIMEKCHHAGIKLSIGLTDTEKTPFGKLVARADQLLYKSKNKGKNQINEG